MILFSSPLTSLLSSGPSCFARSDDAAPAPNPDPVGALPEWKLDDLYSGLEDPAITEDFEIAAKEASDFAAAYQGKLASSLGEDGGVLLGEALKQYEVMQERMGKLISFAGLMYSGNTTDPARAKFYGDVQEKITTISTQLLFFELEINRIEDDVLGGAIAGNDVLGHYKPWLDDLRKEKPYQLNDELEKLFFEKSVTGAMAWNRLFDETMAGLRFSVSIDGESKELPIANRRSIF